MPQPNSPATHDDRIKIDVILGGITPGPASLTDVLILQHDVTPGGALFAEFTSVAQVEADVTAGNLTTTSTEIARVAFAQGDSTNGGQVGKILFGGVDFTATTETAAEALDAIIDAGAQFYGIAYADRDEARQVALGVAVEALAADPVTPNYFLYILQSDDADWGTSGVPAAFTGIDGFERTIADGHDDNADTAIAARLDIAHLTKFLAFDPDVQSASGNLPVDEVDALTTLWLTQGEKEFARTNGLNTARPMGLTTTSYIDPGVTMALLSDGTRREIKHIRSADWLRIRMAEAAADLIVARTNRGAPLTVDIRGSGSLANVLEAAMQQGVTARHFESFTFIAIPPTPADKAARLLRFDADLIWTNSLLQVEIVTRFN